MMIGEALCLKVTLLMRLATLDH